MRTRRSTVAALVASAAGFIFLAASPAQGAISYAKVKVPVPPGSEARGLRVHCGQGEEVIAGGVRSSRTAIVLADSAPFDFGDRDITPDDGWEVILANEASGAAVITIVAVCDSRNVRYRHRGPAAHGPAAASQSQLGCTRGVLAGMGVRLFGGPSRAQVIGLAPFGTQAGVRGNGTAQYAVFDRIGDALSVTCTNVRNLHAERLRTQVPPGAGKSEIVRCERGQQAVSGGALALTHQPDVRLASSHPIDDHDRGAEPDDGWRVAVRNLGEEPARIAAGVVCAKATR